MDPIVREPLQRVSDVIVRLFGFMGALHVIRAAGGEVPLPMLILIGVAGSGVCQVVAGRLLRNCHG